MADFNLTTTAVSPTTIDRDDLRTRLRQELHDEDSANYRWTDAVLNRHIDRAVRELSAVWPRERKTTAQTAAGSREVSVPLDQLVRIEAVEYPTAEWPPAFVQWQLYGSVLTLLLVTAPAGLADVELYWGPLHARRAAATGAGGCAALEWANFATNRANVAGVEAAAGYRAWGTAQLRRFQELLDGFGDRGRLGGAGARRGWAVCGSGGPASAIGRGCGGRGCPGRRGRRAATWCSGSR